jgi:hypothetical protein
MKTQPEDVTGDGGNSCITNQNEKLILQDCVQDVAVVVAPGGADDFSHVNPAFREAATRPVDGSDY